jgi:hypothetical protein
LSNKTMYMYNMHIYIYIHINCRHQTTNNAGL